MTKKQFLKELSVRLDILTDEEKKDIIEEYSSVIDEKVKNGQTEEDAIGDFGDRDELVSEILKAYKINPNYGKGKTEGVEFTFKTVENWIKQAATYLSDAFKKVVDGLGTKDGMKSETVFEIIIKVLLFLVIISILKLPFSALDYVGTKWMFPVFEPFGIALIVILKIVGFALYLVLCIFLGMYFFKEYFQPHSKENTNKEFKNKEPKIKETENKMKEEEHVSVGNDKTVSKSARTVWKVFMLILFIIPFYIAISGLTISLIGLGFLTYKGIDVIGLIIVVVGLIILFSYLIYLVKSTYKKYHSASIVLLFVSLFTIGLGSVVTYETYQTLEYHDEVPPGLTVNEKEHRVVATGTIWINNQLESTSNVMYELDDTLADGEVIVVVQYYNDFYNIAFKTKGNEVRITNKGGFYHHSDAVNMIVSDLSAKQLYNYSYFAHTKIKIKTNENTQKLVKIR